METPNQWKPEIEKKYKISGIQEVGKIRYTAQKALLERLYYALQRDWVPDFEDSSMKNAGVLLRVRNSSYKEGTGPEWVVTLKVRRKDKGIHLNQELEASSEEPSQLTALEEEMTRLFGTQIDLRRIAALDYEYARSVGLTKHRMLLEKFRELFRDEYGKILFAIDELPQPLGYFAELEVDETTVFDEWEKKLGLEGATVVAEDYGELVKALQTGEQRVLTFRSAPSNCKAGDQGRH